MSDLAGIPPYTDDNNIRAIIETPKGHRNKFAFDPTFHAFELKGVLTQGAVFPFDFGFIPSTISEDGDPLDVLILMDEPTYPGTLVTIRPIGVLEAQQTSEKEDNRNDRLIAVFYKSNLFKDIHHIDDLPKIVPEEITHFFVSYNASKGVDFKPLGLKGPAEAMKRIKEAHQTYMKKHAKRE